MTNPAEKTDVHYFWPAERVRALRAFAAEDIAEQTSYEKSKRIAWMREFCMEAPDWLQSFEVRERLRNKAEAARNSVQAAGAQLDLLLEEIDALGAPPLSEFDSKWHATVAAGKAAPAAIKLVKPAVAEADPPDPDKPKTKPKLPGPDQKLPSEQLWDQAHGKSPGGKSSLKAHLDKLSDETLRRLHVPAKAAQQVEADDELQVHTDDSWDKPLPADLVVDLTAAHKAVAERRVEPNPDDLPPDEQPKPKAKKAPVKTAADFLAERQKKVAAAKPAAAERPKTVAVKGPHGVTQRAPRTGFRMELDAIADAHGDEVTTFVAHKVLGDVVNTRLLRRAMAKFKGTFPNRDEASANCAEELDKVSAWQDGRDVLRDYAGHFLEHDDGQCSWWRK